MEFNRLLSQAISFYGAPTTKTLDPVTDFTKQSKIDIKKYKSILNEHDLNILINNLNEKV